LDALQVTSAVLATIKERLLQLESLSLSNISSESWIQFPNGSIEEVHCELASVPTDRASHHDFLWPFKFVRFELVSMFFCLSPDPHIVHVFLLRNLVCFLEASAKLQVSH
jgi:hypothetical protein